MQNKVAFVTLSLHNYIKSTIDLFCHNAFEFVVLMLSTVQTKGRGLPVFGLYKTGGKFPLNQKSEFLIPTYM